MDYDGDDLDDGGCLDDDDDDLDEIWMMATVWTLMVAIWTMMTRSRRDQIQIRRDPRRP